MPNLKLIGLEHDVNGPPGLRMGFPSEARCLVSKIPVRCDIEDVAPSENDGRAALDDGFKFMGLKMRLRGVGHE